MEEAFIACFILPNLKERFEPEDIKIFEKWILKYINNWAKCDSFSNHTLEDFIVEFPKEASRLKKWTESKNRWLRRASAVSLIIPAKKGMFLKDIFYIADKLLLDRDDLVQKGYGWLLKEAGRKNRLKVFDYVMKNKNRMPRTALRYAIELMPRELKKKAMEK